ncbi:MAG: hypothetical protein IJW24_01780 [Clostridia bacterium]|nr:hypothetical protein [Clostridia bacterium]
MFCLALVCLELGEENCELGKEKGLVEIDMEELELLIAKKKSGQVFTHEDTETLAKIIADDGSKNQTLVEFLETLNVKNFCVSEAVDLSFAIARSGKMLEVSKKIGDCVAKDNAGYVGDCVSLVVMSVLASLGVKTLKVANTKYSSFGGTISKLKMFDGFDADVGEKKFIQIAEEIGCSILENNGQIAPADRELLMIMKKFAVPSIPMLAVSFLSKKIALGASIVIFDVKCGEGGLVKSTDDAYKLGKFLVEASKKAGLLPACVVSAMSQPTSASIGGIHEIKEVIRSLTSGDAYFSSDMMSIAKEIVEVALILSGKAKGRSDAGEMFDGAVLSGSALSKFKQIVLAFGGTFESVNTKVSVLEGIATSFIEADEDGFLADINAPALCKSYLTLAGDGDKDFDKNAGIVMLVREGTRVKQGDKIARVHYSFDNQNFPLALPEIRSSICVKAQKPRREKLLVKVFV